MNRWLQSRMRIKRVYFLVGGGLFVLLVAFALTALLSKSGSTPSDTVTQTPTTETENVSTSAQAKGSQSVIRIPLNKTLDEAKAEGIYPDTRTAQSSSSKQTNQSTTEHSVSSSSTPSSGQTSGTKEKEQAAISGQGLDSNTVNQLRSHGIREGDLVKIDRMVAEGFDPKEIAQSLRKNGNPNLASVMDQVPRKPKPEKSSAQEEKGAAKQNTSASHKNNGQIDDDNENQQEGHDD